MTKYKPDCDAFTAVAARNDIVVVARRIAFRKEQNDNGINVVIARSGAAAQRRGNLVIEIK